MDGPTTRVTLLNRLQDARDNAAWTEFVTLYGPLAYQLARRRGMSPELADYIAQSMCVRVARAMPGFAYERSRGRFRKWVLTIALNEMRRYQRHEAARQRHLGAYQESCAANGDIDASAEAWWDRQHAQRLLQIALDRLQAQTDATKYAIFTLVALEGVPIEKVATSYCMTRSQVSVIKFRLMKRLHGIAQQVRAEWGGD